MDWTGWLGWLVAAASLLLNGWQYIKDRPRLVINARYLPDVHSYVIEARNVGGRPITVTGAGLGGIPSYFEHAGVHVWDADQAFPVRVEGGDSKYFTVWWGDDVVSREQAGHAWVRDAGGKSHVQPLKNGLDTETGPQNRIVREELPPQLTAEQIATKLYNLEIQREQLQSIQIELAPIDAEVELLKLEARQRYGEQLAKQSTKRSVDS